MASLGWSVDTIEVRIPDLEPGNDIEVFRDQKVSIGSSERIFVLKATDSLVYADDEGGKHVLASVTLVSMPENTDDLETQDQEALNQLAHRAWRMTSFIISFITQTAMGAPAVLPPSLVAEDRRSKPVFSIGTTLEEE